MSAKSSRSQKSEQSQPTQLPEVDNSEEQIYESVSHPPSTVLEDVLIVSNSSEIPASSNVQTDVKKVIPSGDDQSSEPPASATAISAKVIEPLNSMSLYGSHEELVFSTSSNSDYSLGGVVGEPTSFWKHLLLVVMAPYAAVGVPISSIISLATVQPPPQSQLGPERIRTAQAWLQYLFSTPLAMAVNGCEAFLVLLLNLYIVYLFAGPLYSLLVNRQMTERLVSLTVHLYEIIPLVYGLNVVWFKGFSLSAIIRLLDVKVPSKDADRPAKLYGSLLSAGIAYFAHIFASLVSVVSFEWKAANFYITEGRSDFYYHLMARFYLFLLVPVYLTIVSVSLET